MDTKRELKLSIIEKLFNIDDINILKSVFHQLEKTYPSQTNSEVFSFMEAVQPVRENVTLEDIIAEQNYHPISYQQFRKQTDEIEWTASLTELLNALSK